MDVTGEQYYFDAVLWAYDHVPQITAGTDERHFSPNSPCTREQAVSFLWKALGAPWPTASQSPFADVDPLSYYGDAVLWAWSSEPRIAAGMGPGRFGTGSFCTREQAVTFLWRALGSPEPTHTESPFTDVSPGRYSRKAVLWAWENGITDGIGGGRFGPGRPCTRAQLVTFLYLALTKPGI